MREENPTDLPQACFDMSSNVIEVMKHKNAYKWSKIKRLCFMCIKTSKGKKVTYSLICILHFHMVASWRFWCLLRLFCIKSFRKKNKEFKTALITSFTLLLTCFYSFNFRVKNGRWDTLPTSVSLHIQFDVTGINLSESCKKSNKVSAEKIERFIMV